MVQQLPKFAALKSKYNNKYLRYVNDACSPIRSFPQYSGESVFTPYTKVEFVPAQCDSSLVHIRCCYSNKYWCSWPSDHHFIVAGADQKEEDKSKSTCTLFKPVYDRCHESFRFWLVHLGLIAVYWRGDLPFRECLRAQWSEHDKDLCDLNMVINWDSMMSLPKHIACKGDNGSYLSVRTIDNLPYLQFASKCIDDPTIQMETFITNDGRTRIKSKHCEKFWCRGKDNWIFADSTDTTSQNPDTLFHSNKVTPNVCVVRNWGNGFYCKRFTTGSKISHFNAQTKDIDVHCHLELTELVRSREIYCVEFRLSHARIFPPISIALVFKEATNNTNAPITLKLILSYTNTRSSTWSSSISMKLLNVKTTIRSGVPIIADGKKMVMLPNMFHGEYKWGETITTSIEEKKTVEVTIPPMSIITVTLFAASGACEVPFSYKQFDILKDGKAVEYSFDDGVYRGINYYNFKHEIKTKPICGCPNK